MCWTCLGKLSALRTCYFELLLCTVYLRLVHAYLCALSFGFGTLNLCAFLFFASGVCNVCVCIPTPPTCYISAFAFPSLRDYHIARTCKHFDPSLSYQRLLAATGVLLLRTILGATNC